MVEGVIRRGSFVTVAMQGDYGKPRPVLIVQSDLFAELASYAFCPLTTAIHPDAHELRLTIEPSPTNGLRAASQIMIDKISVVPRAKVGAVIGEADEATMQRVTSALTVFLGVV